MKHRPELMPGGPLPLPVIWAVVRFRRIARPVVCFLLGHAWRQVRPNVEDYCVRCRRWS